LTVLLFTFVVAAACVFALVFRVSAEAVIEWYSGDPHAPDAAESVHWAVRWAGVAAAVFVAACIGRAVEQRRPFGTGIEAVAASARGEQRRISLTASAGRAAGTWVSTVGLSSIGRESAIIEMGGAVGTVVGRRTGGRGDVLATAGIVAAFAAAYHAPVAAFFYVEEHLKVSRSWRALRFTITSAVASFVLSTWLLGGHVIFPAPSGPRWETLWLSLAVLLPAVVAGRLFRVLRVRVKATPISLRAGVPWWTAAAVLAVVAGAAVAVFPMAAGNGMETLRLASGEATLAIALALALGKLVGTTASLGSGAPGGALTPTMAIASGAALLVLLGLERFGLDVRGDVVWGVMVSAMAVGVAVGLRSPLMSVVLIPELVGDYTLLPLIAAVVAITWLVDRVVDRLIGRVGRRVPDVVFDEDG
jgi:CIC family chloride channel protein